MKRSKTNRKPDTRFVEVDISGTVHLSGPHQDALRQEQHIESEAHFEDSLGFKNLENFKMALFFNRIQSQIGKK